MEPAAPRDDDIVKQMRVEVTLDYLWEVVPTTLPMYLYVTCWGGPGAGLRRTESAPYYLDELGYEC